MEGVWNRGLRFPGNSVPVCISLIQLPDRRKQALATLPSCLTNMRQRPGYHIPPLAAPLPALIFRQIQPTLWAFLCSLSNFCVPSWVLSNLAALTPVSVCFPEVSVLIVPRQARALPRFLTPLCSSAYLSLLLTCLPAFLTLCSTSDHLSFPVLS